MKIKIIDSSTVKNFEKKINKQLKKGWKIKGNVFKGIDSLNVVLYKRKV
jgi:hypothetical protein